MRSRMRGAGSISLGLLLSAASLLACGEGVADGPSLTLVSSVRKFALGEPVSLRLRIENAGTSPFFIERPRDLGAGALYITAVGPECTVEVTSSHFDISAGDYRYFLVPLLVGDALEIGLPSFNDLAGLDTLILRQVGRYTIQATWTSTGAAELASAAPIWRGVIASERLTIELLPPDPSRATVYEEAIDVCLSEAACDEFEAIEYFRIVKAPRVAHKLRRLLLRDYESNPRIAEAVANQGGLADVQALMNMAVLTTSPELHSYFLLLARRSGSGDPCAHTEQE